MAEYSLHIAEICFAFALYNFQKERNLYLLYFTISLCERGFYIKLFRDRFNT